jgi:hypothetical protein
MFWPFLTLSKSSRVQQPATLLETLKLSCYFFGLGKQGKLAMFIWPCMTKASVGQLFWDNMKYPRRNRHKALLP